MSELSTADQAGGTTPRDRDTKLGADTAERADFETREPSAPTPASTMHRTSQLANPAAHDGADTSADATPLFPTGEAEGFRSRWQEAQTSFVDEPRHAVEQADGLVAEMMQRLAKVFADERSQLEEQWSRGNDISTEDLRVALQRYRSFFDRLLAV